MGTADRGRRDGFALAGCHTGGLWLERGKPRSICSDAADGRGLPYGGSTRFMGVQLGGKVIWAGSRGCGTGTSGQQRDATRCLPDEGAPRSGCCSPVLARSSIPADPQPSFPQVRRSDWPCGPAAPPLFACGMPTRAALAVLAWSGDGSPVWGCTTTIGDQVPPRTQFRKTISNCCHWHRSMTRSAWH